MVVGPGRRSSLFHVARGLAYLGLDPRPLVNRVRNFILRPIRIEMEALRDEARREVEALRRERQDAVAHLEHLLNAATEHWERCVAEQHASLHHEIISIRKENESTRDDLIVLLGTERLKHQARLALLERLVSVAPHIAPATAVQAERSGLLPTISIILPTWNRAHSIMDAIGSVQAQHYTDWELIIVDDGSTDDTERVIQPFLADPRIRLVQQSRLGPASARNRGISLARGSMIAYLDSDNVWFPRFLYEATEALRLNPSVDLVYGVLVSDIHNGGAGCLCYKPFDRAALLQGNFIDINTVVHRAHLIETYGDFDEGIGRLLDWDILLRYTKDRPALSVPVLAARYQIRDDQRISDTVPFGPNWVAISRKWYPAAVLRRPLRVLYAMWHYPQLSETYIEAEILCMRRWGVDVEVWRSATPAVPYPTSVVIHDGSLEKAVRQFRPDLIHIHWLGFALSHAQTFSTLDVPVTIRLHGFDVTADRLGTLLNEPWVRAVYAFPAQTQLLDQPDRRLKPVTAAFETALFQPKAQKNRRMVVRTGAALPSKDIPFFFELAKRLPDYRFVFAGVTCTNIEHYCDELRELHRSTNSPVELLFDLPHEAAADLIAHAAIYVHTTKMPDEEFAAPIGMPISIAEAMATGAYILVREIPELADYVGDAGTTYRDVEHAAEIIAATADWSDHQWSQARMRSVDRAFMNHADEIVLRPVFEDWCAMAGAETQGAA